MEYENIDRLQQLRQQARNIEPTAEQKADTQASDVMVEFAEHQIYANLKATNKPVSQMSDQEKLIYPTILQLLHYCQYNCTASQSGRKESVFYQ